MTERDQLTKKQFNKFCRKNDIGDTHLSNIEELEHAFSSGFTAGENSERVLALVRELEYFIARVENPYHEDGPIRSKKTYDRFKQALTQFKGGV